LLDHRIDALDIAGIVIGPVYCVRTGFRHL
jgi:hypothetical protein